TAEPVASDWFLPPSTVEVQEGGESLWDLWHEESSRMELAFAETQPASTPTHEAAALNHEELGEVLALARRGNRACPRPPAWAALHATLGGEGQADLAPPPLQPWVWRTLSSLQRRQRFS